MSVSENQPATGHDGKDRAAGKGGRIPLRLLADPGHLLALGFGAGCIPAAPGTFGTLAAIPLFLALHLLPLPGYVLVTALAFVLGIALCGRTARRLGVHDHSGIVWDEVVGYLVTMIGLPAQWPWIAAGFVLFRVLDIWKPWPIRILDRHVGGGLGIMLDDLAAGILAAIVLNVTLLIMQLQ